MQFVVGIQTSIYYMSMWPYLHGMDKTAEMHFLGWAVASCSLGCSLASPLFGYWHEKTLSVVWPIICGFFISAFGQCMYGLLPMVENNHRWFLIVARFFTGFGTGRFSPQFHSPLGSLTVLRAYTATAASATDRLSAISYATAAWMLGISLGPAIQAMFTPIGNGWMVAGVEMNMYSIPAFFMATLSILSALFFSFFMRERYSGIVLQEEIDVSLHLPSYDSPPAVVCVWLWIVSCMIATNIEVISTPLATALYGWNDSQSIRFNGIIEFLTCIVSVLVNFLIGSTRIGQIDKRKQIIFGLILFLCYHILNYPWPFYPGPLRFIPPGHTSEEKGGCDWSFVWCETSVAVPLSIFVFSFIFLFGIAFPLVGSPCASLYSEILGPRPQGLMQGLYSFGGSSAQFISPTLATFLFEHSGYRWMILSQIFALSVALALVLLFYRRLVPLSLLPSSSSSKISTTLP